MRSMDGDLNTPGERLRYLRKKAGYDSSDQFAHALRLKGSTVRAHENGTREITAKAAEKYAPRLRVAPEAILYGRGLNQLTETTPIKAEVPIAVAFVPLLFCHDVPELKHVAAGAIPMSETKVPVVTGLATSKRTFAYQINDASMEGNEKGNINQGDYIFVDPEEKLQTDCIVLAIEAPGFALPIVRKYVITSYADDSTPRYNLIAINRNHPDVLGAHETSTKIVGRVMGRIVLF
jgi:SOS-response transcriptional repressor LexA